MQLAQRKARERFETLKAETITLGKIRFEAQIQRLEGMR